MKRLFAPLIAFALSLCMLGCATTGALDAPDPQALLKASYETVNTYVVGTQTALMRGRITPKQAMQASMNAREARTKVDNAAIALALCETTPCPKFYDLLQTAQPDLLKLEAELRKKEGAAK